MGFFRKTQAETAPVPLPQGGTVTDRITASANAGLDKATQIYNRNPKLVGGLAAVAGAILLSRMKRPRA